MSPDIKSTAPQRKCLRRVLAGAVSVGLASSLMVAIAPGTAQADELGGWELDALNVHEAWDTTQGEGVTVAVVDTGIREHPFFDDKDILPGHSFIDEDQDGHEDRHGHGSEVASSVLTVAPEATLLPVKATIGKPDLFEEDDFLPGRLKDAEIVWAVDNGADVIVMPFGTSSDDIKETQAVQYALDNDVVVIAGAGNDPEEHVWWPAAYDGVIAVSGIDENKDLYVDSTTGEEVTVTAPAADVKTVQFEGGFELTPDYGQSWGTSTASGLVGGLAALVLAADSEVDANNAVARMIETTEDLGDSGHDPEFGYGLLDAGAAISSDINDHHENPLGYPMGEAGASEGIYDDPDDEEDSSDTTPADSEDSAQSETDELLGLPPLIFWGLAGFIILDIVLVTAFLIYRNRRNNQPPPPAWQPPTAYQNPTG